jgi:AmmeMemoRadiSam system protein B
MIREPAVAGQFYPANPHSLRADIQSYLAPTEPLMDASGIVAPHAGYVYSGAVAGAVYAAVRIPGRFILLGPNHTGRGAALALHPAGQWRTPLGLAAIDDEISKMLLQECDLLTEDKAAHAREHSLEVQLPFLQVLAESPRFAAICIGTSDYSALEAVGHALARVIRAISEPVLLIASSDMSHYERADVASRKDRCAIDKIVDLNPKGLYQTIIEKDVSMCGFAPTVALLTACQDLGAKEGRLIRYANSGDVNGDYRQVVGYAALAICRS